MSKYYAVNGLESGPCIFTTWTECEAAVKGQKGLKYKKFFTEQDALTFCGNGKTLAANSCYNAASLYSTKDADAIIVYADGSAMGNGTENAIAGAGVFFGDNDPRNTAFKIPAHEPQTNQRAELMAAVIALEKSEDVKNKPLEIRTDSKYIIQGATNWHFRWVVNNFKTVTGQPVLHADLWRRLASLLESRPGNVVWKHVKGHSGEPGNDAADRLAREGALRND